MGSAKRGVELYNTARNNASAAYQAATQEVTVQTDFKSAMAPLIQYAPYMNEFLTFIVNKIAYQVIEQKIYSNKFAMLKRDGYPLGTDIEANYINPAKGRDYSISLGDTLLNRTRPDVKTAYFRQNRRRQFPITIPRELMQGAFTAWEQLDDMTSGIINSMYSGNEIEEENLVIKTLQDAVTNNVIKKTAINWDLTASPAESVLNLGKLIQSTAAKMKHFSSDYNNYQAYAASQGITDATPAITWVDDNDYYIFITVDALTEMNYEVLAAAFNLDKVALQGRIAEVPSFAYHPYSEDTSLDFSSTVADPNNIIAIVMDAKTVKYSDQLQTTGTFYNPAGLYNNQYYNIWQTWQVLPWGNALAICAAS